MLSPERSSGRLRSGRSECRRDDVPDHGEGDTDRDDRLKEDGDRIGAGDQGDHDEVDDVVGESAQNACFEDFLNNAHVILSCEQTALGSISRCLLFVDVEEEYKHRNCSHDQRDSCSGEVYYIACAHNKVLHHEPSGSVKEASQNQKCPQVLFSLQQKTGHLD